MQNAAGVERVVSIVGTDEVDLNRNHISWVSPLGRALLKSAAGDSVVLHAPGGTEYLDVLEVCYERIAVEPFRAPPGSEAKRTSSPTAIHLTKVSEAAHENSRSRARTICEPTIGLFVPLLSDPSRDHSL
jgi:transcription elongation factor GreB